MSTQESEYQNGSGIANVGPVYFQTIVNVADNASVVVVIYEKNAGIGRYYTFFR